MIDTKWFKVKVPDRQGTVIGVRMDSIRKEDYWIVYSDGVVYKYNSYLKEFTVQPLPRSIVKSMFGVIT